MSVVPRSATVLLAALAAAAAAGCSSGKQVKLEMNREVVLTQPAIQSLSLSPSARIDTSSGPSTVTVRLEGDENLKASFEVPGLVTTQPMREDSPGVYVGMFEVRQGLSGRVPVNALLLHEPSGAKRQASLGGGLELFVGKGDGGAAAGGAGGAGGAGAGSGGACSAEELAQFDAALAALTVHFAVNLSELSQDERAKLSAATEVFRSHPACAISVHGHADEVGYEGYNLHLSMRRALEAASFLESLGVPADRLRRRWHGEAEPLEKGLDDTSRAKNRRVEFHAAPLS